MPTVMAHLVLSFFCAEYCANHVVQRISLYPHNDNVTVCMTISIIKDAEISHEMPDHDVIGRARYVC